MPVDWPMVVLAGLVGITLLAGGWLFQIFAIGTLVGTVIYLLACWLYRANRPFRSPLLGWVLKLIGLTGLVALVATDLAGDRTAAMGAFANLNSIPPQFGLVLVWLALVPMCLGYKLCQRTFTARQHTDTRPSIIFLRAFNDDEFTSLQPSGWTARFHGLTPPFALFEGSGWNRKMTQSILLPVHPVRLFKLLFNMDRYYSEELFSSVFREYGPVVAIGRPGEWFATAGSEKMYVGDSEWKQVVLDYLKQSQVVILQPSKSEGVRWEVEQVLREVPLEKVLLCLSNFHQKPDDYDDFRFWVYDRTKVKLPKNIPFLPAPALVYFDAEGTPKVQPVCYRSPLLWPIVSSGVDERRTFGPFLRRLDGKPCGEPSKPPRHVGQRALSIILTFAVLFGFIVAIVLWRTSDHVPISEQSVVEQVIRDGIKGQKGFEPTSLSLQGQNGSYAGTVLIGTETWDVTAKVVGNDVEWKAQPRMTRSVVERTASDIIRKHTRKNVQKMSLTEQPDGTYQGTATINGVLHWVHATPSGQNVECQWGLFEPHEK